MALARCGASPITSLDDSSEKARLALDYYEPTVQMLLRKHPWNFAIRRVELAKETQAPLNEWLAQYALPSDPYCLRVLQVNDGYDDFIIEGRKILTDAVAVKLRYVARVNESEFDQIFVRCLALELAAAMSYRLTLSDSQRGQILQELNQIALPDARNADAMEQREPLADPAIESTWVSARYARLT